MPLAVTVEPPFDLISFNIFAETVTAGNILCYNDTTSLLINASGGTGNYLYSLFNGADTIGSQLNNYFTVDAGNYTAVAEDENNCKSSATVEVKNPLAINATTNVGVLTCLDSTTSLEVNATGGAGKYFYTLSDSVKTTGPQNDNRFTVTAGKYSVTVTDENHCLSTPQPVIVKKPPPVTLTAKAEPLNCYNGLTTLTINAKGGTGNYQYILSDGINIIKPQTNNTFKVGAGDYTATVRDDYYCSDVKTITIKEASSECFDAMVFPNPSKEAFNLLIDVSTSDKLSITVTDVHGKQVYRTVGNSTGKYKFGSNFSSGVYMLRIKQGNIVKVFKLIKMQ